MILTTIVFVFNFNGYVRLLELGILICALILAALAQINKKRFIVYELLFIYMSHASVLVAMFALK